MKISSQMTKLLNEQIALEANASNSYLAMASWAEVTGYEGAAGLFFQQADEERMHMLKIIHYLNDVGAKVIIPAAKQPAQTFKSLEGICKTALANEKTVTKAIHKMADLAQKQKDQSTFAFLQWFVNEQVEEEKKFETILQKFDLVGRDKLAIYQIDQAMAGMKTAEPQ